MISLTGLPNFIYSWSYSFFFSGYKKDQSFIILIFFFPCKYMANSIWDIKKKVSDFFYVKSNMATLNKFLYCEKKNIIKTVT